MAGQAASPGQGKNAPLGDHCVLARGSEVVLTELQEIQQKKGNPCHYPAAWDCECADIWFGCPW